MQVQLDGQAPGRSRRVLAASLQRAAIMVECDPGCVQIVDEDEGVARVESQSDNHRGSLPLYTVRYLDAGGPSCTCTRSRSRLVCPHIIMATLKSGLTPDELISRSNNGWRKNRKWTADPVMFYDTSRHYPSVADDSQRGDDNGMHDESGADEGDDGDDGDEGDEGDQGDEGDEDDELHDGDPDSEGGQAGEAASQSTVPPDIETGMGAEMTKVFGRWLKRLMSASPGMSEAEAHGALKAAWERQVSLGDTILAACVCELANCEFCHPELFADCLGVCSCDRTDQPDADGI